MDPYLRHLRSAIYPAILLALLVGTIWYVSRNTNLEPLQLLSVETVTSLLLLAVANLFVGTLRLYLILRAMECSPSFVRTFLVLSASGASSLTIPVKAGYPLRIYFYREAMGIPAGKGMATIALETISILAIGAIVSLVGFASIFQDSGSTTIGAVILAGVAVGTILLFAAYGNRITEPLLKRLPPNSQLARRLSRLLTDFNQGMNLVSKWAMLQYMALSVLKLGVLASMLWVILRALDAPVALIPLVSVQAASMLAGFASMIPLGLGVMEGSTTILLGYLGVPTAMALTAAIILRAVTSLSMLVVGSISIATLGLRPALLGARNPPNGAGPADPDAKRITALENVHNTDYKARN
jgi:uncharacterized protein (TIRG00374 family)